MLRVLHMTRFCMVCIVERLVLYFFVVMTFYEDPILTGVVPRLIGLSWTIEGIMVAVYKIMIFFVFLHGDYIQWPLSKSQKRKQRYIQT